MTDYKFCSGAYEKLADVTCISRYNFNFMYFWCLMYYVSDIMYTATYSLMSNFEEPKETVEYFKDFVLTNITIVLSSILCLSPIYMADKLSSQVQELRMLLYDKLLYKKGNTDDLIKFIDFIEAQPFRFTIAKILPLDWSLLIVQLLADVPRLLMTISFSLFFVKKELSLVMLDKERNENILRLVRFMEAQPLKRKIWGVVPYDLRLPVTLVSLCTTYIIVIIQMSHMYDN
ncbi:uncharacterized protein LOC106131469 [Amyelois transitella]|uniref:uncharacterized protein LOC106131469 n=1 Tax=Amyelois transitella TaxID=680683 RepID=UPI00298FCF5D|nr:uncharacterized protein LOC106131469 [Amyelois transitella]